MDNFCPINNNGKLEERTFLWLGTIYKQVQNYKQIYFKWFMSTEIKKLWLSETRMGSLKKIIVSN